MDFSFDIFQIYRQYCEGKNLKRGINTVMERGGVKNQSKCHSPSGEYNLRLGIIKELHPDMVAAYSGSTQVFEGHPFIVEAGLSLGGTDVKQDAFSVSRSPAHIPLGFTY